jgi:hypothetical protein
MFGRSGKFFSAPAVGVLLTCTLCACGGASSSSSSPSASAASTNSASHASSESSATPGASDVVARLGSAPITRAQVNHWMGVLAAQDYYELSKGQTEPAGLVSDPPDYGACVHRLEVALSTSPSAQKGAALAGAQLLTKCRELNQKVRGQAVTSLLEAQIVNALAAEQGVSASEAEVLRSYEASSNEQLHSKAAQAAYLAARRTSIADELTVARNELLSRTALSKLKGKGGGMTDVAKLEQRLKAKTDCSPGYVVEQCSQFHGEAPADANPSAAVLTEQIAALLTGRCVNVAACGKA